MGCCSCTEHPLIHGDCRVPDEPCLILYRKEKKAGVPLIELARFDDEAFPPVACCGMEGERPPMDHITIDLTDRHGRGHDMMCAGWRTISPTKISLVTPKYHYYLVDARLKAFMHHQEFLECLANSEQLPYLWQD